MVKKIFAVFDSNYYVREYIGYVEADSATEARIIVIHATESCRIPRILRDANIPSEAVTDQLIRWLALGYIAENIRLEQKEKPPEPEGFNWFGRLNDEFA